MDAEAGTTRKAAQYHEKALRTEFEVARTVVQRRAWGGHRRQRNHGGHGLR